MMSTLAPLSALVLLLSLLALMHSTVTLTEGQQETDEEKHRLGGLQWTPEVVRQELELMREELGLLRDDLHHQAELNSQLMAELRTERQLNSRQDQLMAQLREEIEMKSQQLREEMVQRETYWRAKLESHPKRSDDMGSVETVLSEATQRLDQHDADIQALQNAESSLSQAVTAHDQARGTTYTRWGNAACSNTSELVYSGILGGGLYTSGSAPANFLCMVSTPQYDDHPLPNIHALNYVYGSEYDICSDPVCETTPLCAVCRVPRAASVMLPGSNVCASGWHLEYTGHLMAGAISGHASSEYICVDSTHAYLPGTHENENQNVMHFVASKCGSLPCPPYANDKIVTCAVCSR